MPDSITNQALVAYDEGNGSSPVDVIVQGETLWATQKAISRIFATERSVIAKHLKSIYEIGELEEKSTVQKMHIANLDKPVQTYSLDAIISVGYRVNSKKATQFRKWATGVLGQYIRDGYVIDEIRLREEPEKLNKLAAKIRELRASEKNVYASVRECFRMAASDYEPSSQEVKSFYALLQDKFHHAVTNMTSSKLILDRAHHEDANMGLQSIKNNFPSLQEAKTGKNYLSESELYRLHLLSEQFLLYAETTALRGENMTMKQLHKQLDNLLLLNGYPVFGGYKDYLKEEAMAHAEREHKLHMEIKKLELLGVNVDLEWFYAGEYDEFREQTARLSTRDMNYLADERKAASLPQANCRESQA
ncbi:MAG: RhuM family protein [Acidithiobacillus sp.]